jgi:hypothetical protein
VARHFDLIWYVFSSILFTVEIYDHEKLCSKMSSSSLKEMGPSSSENMGHSLREMDPCSLSEMGPSSWGIMVFEANGPWRNHGPWGKSIVCEPSKLIIEGCCFYSEIDNNVLIINFLGV